MTKKSSFSLSSCISLQIFCIFYRVTKQIFYLNSERRKNVPHFFKDLNVLKDRKREKKVYGARFKGLFNIFAGLHCRFAHSGKYLVVLWTPLSFHNAIVYTNSPINRFPHNHLWYFFHKSLQKTWRANLYEV